ncbi:HAD family hydrolase [Roseivirga pacifica]|uniref:HAD family hydrolase n=1 Tax=Roseivirga pacifica TaxID=1267423 RepID=UPI00227BA42D|nr:HAD family hydrolase [Roseivirga pacifica]
MKKLYTLAIISGLLLFACSPKEEATKEPAVTYLSSWNDGATKQAIMDFVTKTTTEGSADFIPVADRIATFDNDGNLWAEQPVYFQLLFAIDQIKAMAPEHPEWKNEQPYKALLEGDIKAALAGGEKALLQIVMTTHGGMSNDEFSASVKNWIDTATHPKTGKHYNEMIYQPMVELLEYLRAHDFKTFIVSGGGVDFMRVWVEEAYGIPPYQVVGSSNKARFEVAEDGSTSVVKLQELNFIDDKEGKPVGIYQHIGQRPVFASGNSDGDYQMLQWTTMAKGYPRFGLLLHHTDAEREWAYDRESHIGQLNKGLDDAQKFGWTVIDMKNDWKKVFPFDK